MDWIEVGAQTNQWKCGGCRSLGTEDGSISKSVCPITSVEAQGTDAPSQEGRR